MKPRTIALGILASMALFTATITVILAVLAAINTADADSKETVTLIGEVVTTSPFNFRIIYLTKHR